MRRRDCTERATATTGRCTRLCRGERGASILELALITPVMVLLVMGVLDLARGYQMQIQLESAAQQGAALAQIFPNDVSCETVDDITARVADEEPGVASLPDFRVAVFAEAPSGELTVPVTGCGGTTAASGGRVLVEVSATFNVVTPMVQRVVGKEIDITGSAEIVAQG